jgi:gamma-polyglutamate biosynthesis protein CapA
MKKILPFALKSILTLLLLFISGCATLPQKEIRVSFCAAGDIMLDRGVKRYMQNKGGVYPFRDITGFIKRHELSFCNLEGPVSTRGKKRPKAYSFRFDPELLDGLKNTGFNMFSLANNHILDYGGSALMDTIDFMEGQDYLYAGAGKNRQEASAARYREINGLKFAFIANVDFGMAGWQDSAGDAVPQAFDRRDLAEITAEIEKAKKLADFVIVSFHWGEEYQNYPNKRQKNIAHACIDSGADLVIGHHPHVMQGVEKYKGKLIFYSIGNFIFDQRFPRTNESMFFACDFTKNGIENAFLLPVKITKGQPDFASGEEAKSIKGKIMEYSKDFGVEFKDSGVKIEIE